MPQQINAGNSDLAELAQLAQVMALLQHPQQQQQELAQQDRAAKLTAAIHLMGLQQQHEKDKADLAELTRYHTGELTHGAAALDEQRAVRDAGTKASLLGDLMRTPGADVGTIEDTLAKVYPEYGAARQERQTKVTAAEVAKFAPVVGAAKDENTRKQILSTLHPDTQAGINEALKSTQAAATPTVAPVATNTPGYYPGVLPGLAKEVKYAPIDLSNIGAGIVNKGVVPVFNLINSLLGTPPATTVGYTPRDYNVAIARLLGNQPTTP